MAHDGRQGTELRTENVDVFSNLVYSSLGPHEQNPKLE